MINIDLFGMYILYHILNSRKSNLRLFIEIAGALSLTALGVFGGAVVLALAWKLL